MCAEPKGEGGGLSVEKAGGVAIIRSVDPPILMARDLARRDRLLEALAGCSRDPAVQAVVLVPSPHEEGRLEYAEFFRSQGANQLSVELHRLLNVVKQVVTAIVSCDCIVVFTASGPVLSHAFNVGLACDRRVVGDDLVIERAYLRHGLIPKGGGAYFLGRLLGRRRALEVLLSEEDVTALRAEELGLVDEVVPADELEEAAVAAAQRFTRAPASTTRGVKRLLSYELRELSASLDFESEEILRALRTADFSADPAEGAREGGANGD